MTASPEDNQTALNTEGDRPVPPRPDREPTAEEEAAAERAAAGVDIESVAAHEKEMAEKGKNVKGEGQIE
jgi:hypothetical protein